MRVRRDVADSLENRQSDIRRGYLVREVFANEAWDLVLVLKCVPTGNHPTGTVTEQEDRQARRTRLDDIDEGCDGSSVGGGYR